MPVSGVSGVVCGPGSVDGVTYALVSGQQVSCGVDSAGNTLYLQVSTLADDQPVQGGEVVGLHIGGAVLSVLAVAWCFKALARQFNSGGEV